MSTLQQSEMSDVSSSTVERMREFLDNTTVKYKVCKLLQWKHTISDLTTEKYSLWGGGWARWVIKCLRLVLISTSEPDPGQVVSSWQDFDGTAGAIGFRKFMFVIQDWGDDKHVSVARLQDVTD